MSEQSETLTFEAVYAEYSDRIYRYCYRLCNGDAAAAEDVAQETWIRVLRSLDQLQSPAALEGWLYTIARREWQRTRRSPLKTTAMSNAPGTEEIPDHNAAPRIDQLAIQLCLKHLAQPLREALILVKMEGLTHQQAASILKRPQGTVQYQVSEALKRLRRMLVEEGRLASIAPLALLESELRNWGDVPAPPTLLDRLGPVQSGPGGAGPHPSQSTANPSVPAVPGSTPLPTGLAGAAGWRWLVAALLLPVAIVPLTRRRTPKPPPQRPDPERVLAAAAGIRSLHAVGTQEQFNLTRAGLRSVQSWNLDYWYQAPDQVRIESRDAHAPRSTIQVTEGGSQRVRVLDNRTGSVRAYPDSPTRQKVPLTLGFVDPDSPLARLLRNQQERILAEPVQVEGRELRQIRVADAVGGTVRRWQITLDPVSARVVRLGLESTVSGPLGVYVRDRTTLSEISYDAPVPAGIFTLPEGRPVTGKGALSGTGGAP